MYEKYFVGIGDNFGLVDLLGIIFSCEFVSGLVSRKCMYSLVIIF